MTNYCKIWNNNLAIWSHCLSSLNPRTPIGRVRLNLKNYNCKRANPHKNFTLYQGQKLLSTLIIDYQKPITEECLKRISMESHTTCSSTYSPCWSGERIQTQPRWRSLPRPSTRRSGIRTSCSGPNSPDRRPRWPRRTKSGWHQGRNFLKKWINLFLFWLGRSGHFFLYFRLFNRVFITVDSEKNCRWQDPNCGSLVSKTTALPTAPQPLPRMDKFVVMAQSGRLLCL